MQRGAALAGILFFTHLISSMVIAADLDLLTRKEWKAQEVKAPRNPPIKTGKVGEKHYVKAENVMTARAPTKYLTVHHRGVKGNPSVPFDQKLRRFQIFSWGPDYWIGETQIFLGDLPYHYVISYQGTIAEGRELNWSAWSNTNYVVPAGETPAAAITKHITVVLEGNFQEEQPTPEQLKALEQLLYQLAVEHKVPLANITYHADVVAKGKTTCPGANMIKKMPDVIGALEKRGLQ